MRAVIYARFSTEHQTESSIADQERVCRRYAEQHGLSVVAVFSDEGISGASLGNRPGVQRALEAVRAGDVLLVNDLSRLSRSQDLAPLLSRLKHRGVRVVGVQDAFDSESRTARMQAGLSGIMSEEFRAMVADRTHAALESRARAGKATGNRPYDNAEIVREIFRRFAAGETLRAIASDLNARGVPSPGAAWRPRSTVRGRWLVSALHSMLRNEVYVGRLVWNRSKWVKDPDTGKRVRRERPPSEWIVRQVEPVIDKATWDAVQRRLLRRGASDRRASYLLSGILECGLCGSKLVVIGKGGSRYVCSAYKQGGSSACPNDVSFPRVPAEDAILRPIMQDMLSPQAIAEGVRMLREERAAAERAHRGQASQAERELASLERMVAEGVVSADVLAPAIAEARRRVQDERRASAPIRLPWPSESSWKAAVEGMRAVLTGQDIQAARDALKRLLNRVICLPAEDRRVVNAEIEWFQLTLATGTGPRVNFCGSGGVQRQKLTLPTSAVYRPVGKETT